MAAAGPAVIVADDDPAIRILLRRALVSLGYQVHDLKSPGEALDSLESRNADLLVLGLDGLGSEGAEFIRVVRQRSQIPVVALSRRDDDETAATILECGADDFIRKPFGHRELLARIENTLRRRAREQGGVTPVVSGDLEVDLLHHRVRLRGQVVRLSVKRYEVLRILAENIDRPVASEEILRAVWGARGRGRLPYLRVTVRELRVRLEADPSQPRHIVTEPGIGYRLAVVPVAGGG